MLNGSEKGCNIVVELYEEGVYGLLGYTIKAIKGLDIAPSMTFLVANIPSRINIIYQNIPQWVDYNPITSCYMHDDLEENIYTDYVIRKSGVVGTDCVPNTDVPFDRQNCVIESTVFFEPVFKGYSSAFFRGNVNAVKDAIVRFGAVNLQDIGIVIGWDQNYWIAATQDVDNYFGYILRKFEIKIGKKNYKGEVFINADIIKIDCTRDATNPACSGECTNPSFKSTQQCPCLVEDLRIECLYAPQGSADSIRAVLSTVTTIIVLPSLLLLG
ncbi:MAG: hypothetical protein EZS28_043034 [Streblomastix strix]|uniref:Uncharacterized protein n=1 Tax=Streblomastix strix TaxID=222440 RepID=A0A5J4TU58_9EUKA|nr:MAG: hypothetical protein EZS28_043034 [Streblomastix strix]